MLTTDERIKNITRLKSSLLRFPEKISQKARAIIGVSQRIEQIKLDGHFIPAIKALRDQGLQVKGSGKKHFSFFVLKPVGPKCNLHCSYCYHGTVKKSKFKRYSYLKENTIMSEKLLERITAQAVKFLCGKLEFDWHGGEPLLAGLDFYKDAVRIQKRHQCEDIVIKNCIQTNATLINDEWIKFFKEHDFSIGVSLDGTQMNHDLHRFYHSGKGSYDDVVKNLKRLKKAGIKYGAICVITPFHERDPHNLMKTFVDAGITSVKIHFSHHPDLRLSPEEYADYIIDIFEVWLSEYATKISISLFEDIFCVLFGLRLPNCHGKCGEVLLSFEPNGDVWLCDQSFGCEDYRFGNIMERDLGSILNGEKYLGFLKTRTRLTDSCSNCEWHEFCYGGCTYFRTFKTGKIEGENYYCNGMKKIFEYVTKRFDQILEENEKEHSISRQRIPVEA